MVVVVVVVALTASLAQSLAGDPDSSRSFKQHLKIPMISRGAVLTIEPGEEYVEYSRPGEFSGELSLFSQESRMYSCVAVQESVVWRIENSSLKRMLQEDPYLYVVLQRIALRYASHRLHCLVLVGGVHSM